MSTVTKASLPNLNNMSGEDFVKTPVNKAPTTYVS